MVTKILTVIIILLGFSSSKNDVLESNFTYNEQELLDELKYSDDYISKTYTKDFDQNKITIILL